MCGRFRKLPGGAGLREGHLCHPSSPPFFLMQMGHQQDSGCLGQGLAQQHLVMSCLEEETAPWSAALPLESHLGVPTLMAVADGGRVSSCDGEGHGGSELT